MEILVIIFIIIDLLILIWHLATLKYINPYTMDLYIGNKGCGKSSTEAKLILKAMKHNEICYVNAEDIKIDGVRIYDTYDLGRKKVITAHLFIDEL